jgi:hypothetical protein
VPSLQQRIATALAGRYESLREIGAGGMAIVCLYPYEFRRQDQGELEADFQRLRTPWIPVLVIVAVIASRLGLRPPHERRRRA